MIYLISDEFILIGQSLKLHSEICPKFKFFRVMNQTAEQLVEKGTAIWSKTKEI